MNRKGYCSSRFSAFAVSQRRRRRWENDRSFTCLSPWSIVSCWFSLRKTKGKSNAHSEEEDGDDAKNGQIMECLHGGSSSSAQKESGHGKEVSFNLGVGFGIVYLMAAIKCELNKTVDICKEMETLVQDLKMQLQNQSKETISRPSESNVTISKAQDQTLLDHVSLQEHPYSLETQNSDGTSSCSQNIDRIPKDLTKMDQLEAELEVELENLQVQLDSEVMMNCQCSEIVVEDTAPEESITALSFVQEFEPSDETIIEENCSGVSPLELERRLHELLAMRQEERITALESALEYAMQKLHENERELSWWKDTAKLVFQKIPLRYGSLGSILSSSDV